MRMRSRDSLHGVGRSLFGAAAFPAPPRESFRTPGQVFGRLTENRQHPAPGEKNSLHAGNLHGSLDPDRNRVGIAGGRRLAALSGDGSARAN